MKKQQEMTTMQVAFKKSGYKVRRPRKASWPRVRGFKAVDMSTGAVVARSN